MTDERVGHNRQPAGRSGKQRRASSTGGPGASEPKGPSAPGPRHGRRRIERAKDPRAALVRLDSGLLSLRSDALGEVQVSDSLLRSIRPLNAAVTKLTDLQPKETVPGQFLALKLPYQLSTAIGGGPLTIRDNAFDFGFGVHAGSLLTFELGGQFGMLDVTVGIDDSANTPGDAEFIVLADGQEAARSGRLDRQAEPKRWRVPIKGAKTLGLKVLPGATGGVNCRANWAEPVLIKSR